MDDMFAALLADLTYSGDWEGTVEMRTEHGWVDVADRVIALRDDLRAKVLALPEGAERRWDGDDGLIWRSDVLDLLNGGSE